MVDFEKFLGKAGGELEIWHTPVFSEISFGGNLYSVAEGSSFLVQAKCDAAVPGGDGPRGQQFFVKASGKLSVSAPCDRCLAPVELVFQPKVDEVFEAVDGQVVLDPEEDGDWLTDGKLDLDRMILDLVLLDFPSKVLCREDCKGLCPVCGKNRNLESCGCDTAVLDPRMQQFLDVFAAAEDPASHP